MTRTSNNLFNQKKKHLKVKSVYLSKPDLKRDCCLLLGMAVIMSIYGRLLNSHEALHCFFAEFSIPLIFCFRYQFLHNIKEKTSQKILASKR